MLIPLVISRNPLSKGFAKAGDIFAKLKIGLIISAQKFRMPLDFKIEITLAKITTNPPINKIVEVALVILSARTEPKFEKETVAEFLLLV